MRWGLGRRLGNWAEAFSPATGGTEIAFIACSCGPCSSCRRSRVGTFKDQRWTRGPWTQKRHGAPLGSRGVRRTVDDLSVGGRNEKRHGTLLVPVALGERPLSDHAVVSW